MTQYTHVEMRALIARSDELMATEHSRWSQPAGEWMNQACEMSAMLTQLLGEMVELEKRLEASGQCVETLVDVQGKDEARIRELEAKVANEKNLRWSEIERRKELEAEVEGLRNKLNSDSQDFQIECQKEEIRLKQARITELEAEVGELRTAKESVILQAQCWAMEARCQDATVKECYQAVTKQQTATPATFHGANPVRCRIRELEGALRETNDMLDQWITVFPERKSQLEVDTVKSNRELLEGSGE